MNNTHITQHHTPGTRSLTRALWGTIVPLFVFLQCTVVHAWSVKAPDVKIKPPTQEELALRERQRVEAERKQRELDNWHDFEAHIEQLQRDFYLRNCTFTCGR